MEGGLRVPLHPPEGVLNVFLFEEPDAEVSPDGSGYGKPVPVNANYFRNPAQEKR